MKKLIHKFSVSSIPSTLPPLKPGLRNVPESRWLLPLFSTAISAFPQSQCFEILVITGERFIRARVSSGWLASALFSGSKGGSLPRELIFLKLLL